MNRQNRLHWLLAVASGLLILRWLVPIGVDNDVGVAEAIVRKPVASASAPSGPFESGALQVSATSPLSEVEASGNPFAVRTPPPPPPPVQAPVVAVKAPAVVQAPPPVAVDPPPSLQVIGTWDDGSGLAAFVAGPNTTLLARPGVLLLGEYSVTAVTTQQVTLVHVPSRRDVRLPVPRAPGA